jgi:hypothetical protein
MKRVKSVKNLNPAVQLHGAAITRSVVADNFVMALWRTVIGKKVVITVTGVVLVGFVIVHMAGNLKIFSGPEEINAYSRFLREVGSPGLSYGQLLWLVRIVLLVCVTLHITAAPRSDCLKTSGSRPEEPRCRLSYRGCWSAANVAMDSIGLQLRPPNEAQTSRHRKGT